MNLALPDDPLSTRTETVTKATKKYLAAHALPATATLAHHMAVRGKWTVAAAIPVLAENDLLARCFSAMEVAATGLNRRERALAIAVVNSPAGCREEWHKQNLALIENVKDRPGVVDLAENGWLVPGPNNLDVLYIDCTLPPWRPGRRSGVGLARKWGADLALHLFADRVLASAWLGTPDADTAVPADYFIQIQRLTGGQDNNRACSAAIFPFIHVKSGTLAIDQATSIYEKYLFYLRSGLAFAGSPFSFTTIGSCMAVHLKSYAEVRGFPDRNAGEDFHMLNKLRKVAPTINLKGRPLKILCRTSSRVPFGTGRAVGTILNQQQEYMVYHPVGFHLLKILLSAVDRFAKHFDPHGVRDDIKDQCQREHLGVRFTTWLLNEFEQHHQAGIDHIHRTVPHRTGTSIRHAWMCQFDALQTVHFLHRLRDQAAPLVPLPWALRECPFSVERYESYTGDSQHGNSQHAAL